MFNFNGAKSDHTGVGKVWQKSLLLGLTTMLALSSVSNPNTRNLDQTLNTPAQTASFIMQQSDNAFAKDAINNPVQDAIHQNIQKSTVFIMAYKKEANKDFTIESGSGTVIQNSASSESGGYNVIATAGHVVGGGGVKVSTHSGVHISDGNSNYCNEYKCLAFDSGGHLLGKLSVIYTPGTDPSIDKPTNVRNKVQNDFAVLRIEPIDGRYQEIQGVKLASQLSQSIYSAKMHKDFLIAGGNTMNLGADYGLSGGGVFNDKGELAGVLSYTSYWTLKNNHVSPISLSKDIGDRTNSYSNFTDTMYSRIANGEETLLSKEGVEKSDVTMLRNSMYLDSNVRMHSEDVSYFSPLGNASFLEHVGNASDGIRTVKGYNNDQSISVYGYPYTAPVSYQTKIDNSNMPRYDQNLVFKGP